MIRSIAAVAAGYLVFAGSAALLFQLSGQPPHAPASRAFEIGTIVWGVVFALIAGWLTARIAVRHPAMHAAVLASLIALGALLSLTVTLHAGGAIWTQLAALLLMAPAAVAGGALGSRNLEPIG
jgi:hypothetical protein